MNVRKVSLSDRDVQKRYRVSISTKISYWREEFDCDGVVSTITYGKEKGKPSFGTSKYESHVSNNVLVNGYKNFRVLGG